MNLLKQLRKTFSIILIIFLCGSNTIYADAAPSKITISKLTFDAEYYYKTYPDLQTAIGHDSAALYEHYVQNGLKEGRNGSAEFNCTTYMNNNSDLRAVFKDDYLSYCLHYEQYGKKEGRNAITPSNTHKGGNILGTYSTAYNTEETRAINVELSASRINNIIIAPGEEFSYSQTILPRTTENGYVEALMISNNAYTKGMGGGICQVSSTLYAAMLDAGLPATERYPHSLPVAYVPEGMDAAIAAPVKDLKFVNTFEYPIQLIADTTSESGIVTVTIKKQK